MEAYYPHNRMFNDVVFEGRNKNYGAYYLRHRQSRYMVLSILASIAFFILMVNTPYFIGLLKGFLPAPPTADINHGEYFLEPPPVKKFVPVAIQQQPQQQMQKPDQVQFVDPNVTVDDETINDIAPPTIGDLIDNNIGTANIEGDSIVMNLYVPDQPGSGVVIEPAVESTTPFTYVEQMPQFPGGDKYLFEYLANKIKYPTIARENSISGRVVVQFIVSKDGNIYNAKIIKGIGGGCDQEALRAVNAMPVWKPGKHNGRPVDVTFTLPIMFDLK